MHICSPPRALASISNGERPPNDPPTPARSNWLQPILAPTTPHTTSCELLARTPQVAKMAPGAPLDSASGGVEEASLSWPNGPRGRSEVACCDAKGCSQRHPEKARWVKLPPTCLILEFSKTGFKKLFFRIYCLRKLNRTTMWYVACGN